LNKVDINRKANNTNNTKLNSYDKSKR